MEKSRFEIPIIKTEVLVMISSEWSEEEEEKAIGLATEHLDFDVTGGNMNAFSVCKSRNAALWFSDSDRTRVWHECYHATQSVVREIGCEGNDEELMAHIHEYIVEQVLQIWEKSKYRKK